MGASLASIDTDLLDAASGPAPFDGQNTLQQVKTGYTTAIKVQQPRQLTEVTKRLLAEANMAGECFYYGWGAGKDRIEGASIGLAMAAARCFGNAAVDVLPIQETPESWVVSSVFVDLETGFTLTRPFRQSKKSVVAGKHNEERKDDIRFQIGASKSARNVVLNALPKWLIDRAIEEAKAGTRARIEKFIAEKGIAAAVDMVFKGLAKHGVPEAVILDKCGVAKREAVEVDHLVMLRGDLYALDNGQDHATSLFPAMDDAGGKATKSKLNEQLGEKPKGAGKATDADKGNPAKVSKYVMDITRTQSAKDVEAVMLLVNADKELSAADRAGLVDDANKHVSFLAEVRQNEAGNA